MLIGKRTKILAAASIVALAGSFAVPASAQSNAELMNLVRELTARVEQLEARLGEGTQENVTAAAVAAEQAQAAAQQATQAAQVAEQASTAVAAGAQADKGDGIKMKWGPSPTIKSEDGRFEMRVRGRLQADFGSINDNIGDQDRFATEFRRARLGVQGVAWNDIKYKFEIDFADNDVDITDAYLQYKGLKGWKFTVGQFKERVSMEEETSSLQIALMERAAFTDAFGFQRRLGVGVDFNHGDFFIMSALQGGSDLSENEDNEGFVVSVRTFWSPEIGNGGRVLIGGSIRHRDLDNDIDGTDIRYRQRPFAHTSGTRYVSTGTLPEIKSDLWYGFEVAGSFGPFWAAAEYGMAKAEIVSGMEALYNGESSVSFDGGFFDVGWFLTGETRPLKHGKWNRPEVNNPVFEGGWGALALVGRVDYLNLNDSSALVYGGRQVSYIFGVTWLLNRHARIMLNYARTQVSKGSSNMALHGDAVVDPLTGKAGIDAVTGRFQIDW